MSLAISWSILLFFVCPLFHIPRSRILLTCWFFYEWLYDGVLIWRALQLLTKRLLLLLLLVHHQTACQSTFIIICMSWEHNITYSDHTKWKSFGTYRGNWWSLVMTSCCHPERWGMLFAYMWIHCSSLECHTPDLNLSEGLWGHAWSLLLDPGCSGCYDKKLAFIGLWPLFQHSWKVLM